MEGEENGEVKDESEDRGLSCPMKDGATYGEVSRLESFCTRMPHLHPPCALPGPAEGQEFPQGPSSDSAHHGCLCAPPWPANSLYPSLRARLLHLLHQTHLSPATSLLPNPVLPGPPLLGSLQKLATGPEPALTAYWTRMGLSPQ